jgi:predicted dehydrogenase
MANKPENEKTTRRVTAAPAAAKSSVYSIGSPRAIGANDRINVAHVGLGVQGYDAHTRLIKEKGSENNTSQVAVCDLYGRRLRRAGTLLGLSESAWYWDYRKMLENKEIDAVVIATSDNWHAQIAIDAMNADKNVYCEKPMCKTLDEAFGIYDTVKKTGKTFQIGSQGTSDPKYYKIREIVKAGKIGKLVMGQDSYNRGDNKIGEWNSYGDNPFKAPHNAAGPSGEGDNKIDWETFRKGSGPKEWDPDRFFRWRKYWAYGSGLVGDLMPHRLHPLYISMGISTVGNEGFPRRVSAGGVLAVQKVNPDTKKADRDVPDFTYTTVDFDDFSMIVMSTTINEQGMRPMLRGNKATILFAGDSAQIIPERGYSDEVEAETVALNGNGEPIPVHHKNWFECIRTGKQPNGNIDLAVRVQTVISLGEVAFRNNQTMVFDPAHRASTPDYRKLVGGVAPKVG